MFLGFMHIRCFSEAGGGAIEVGQVFSFLTRLQTPLRGSTCCPAHIFRRGDDPGSLVLKGCLHKKYLYALSVRL